MVREISDDVCKCTHPKDDHVTVHIKPEGVNGKTTGYILICKLCLCQGFEPKEQAEEVEVTASCVS